MAVMPREAWTDERLDDLNQQVTELRSDLKAQCAELRAEIKGQGREVKAEIRETRERVDRLETLIDERFIALNRRFDTLTFALIAALVGIIATRIA